MGVGPGRRAARQPSSTLCPLRVPLTGEVSVQEFQTPVRAMAGCGELQRCAARRACSGHHEEWVVGA